MNYEKREEILRPFFEEYEYSGGICRFENLDVGTLQQLIEEKFIELEERQNFSPSTAEFLEFMKKHPGVKCHGYAVSEEREDCRITLEGLQFNGAQDENLVCDFKALSKWLGEDKETTDDEEYHDELEEATYGCDEFEEAINDDGTISLRSWWD